jgi:hypothetical protein
MFEEQNLILKNNLNIRSELTKSKSELNLNFGSEFFATMTPTDKHLAYIANLFEQV